MDNTSYAPPDLASILRTLSSYAPPTQPAQFPTTPELEEGEYDPSAFVPADPKPILATQPAELKAHVPPPSKPRGPDPRTITTWVSALRYVTTYLVPQLPVATRIKHLIHTQHEHEQQWWGGREELLRRQKGRNDARKKLDDTLASIGGLVDARSAMSTTPEQDEKELKTYDEKVYRACGEMVKAAVKELDVLEVPFFGVKGDTADTEPLEENELKNLRSRMIGLLEDLFGE